MIVNLEYHDLPEALLSRPGELLEMYRAVGSAALPGMVVRTAEHGQLERLVLSEGLVAPGRIGGKQEIWSRSNAPPKACYGCAELPHAVGSTTLWHTRLFAGAEELTLASLDSPGTGYSGPDMLALELRTMEDGVAKAGLVDPIVYRGQLGVGDIAVYRSSGPSPTVYRLQTNVPTGRRGTTVRAYEWLPEYA